MNTISRDHSVRNASKDEAAERYPIHAHTLLLGDTMKIEQRQWTSTAGWRIRTTRDDMAAADLVLFFASSEAMGHHSAIEQLRAMYPAAHVIGCSTAGEICGTEVADGTIVATAMHFEHTPVRTAYASISDASSVCLSLQSP